MITYEKLNTAINEAKRFIMKAEAVKARYKKDKYVYHCGCKETGAARRASMDLSNVLSDFRRSDR